MILILCSNIHSEIRILDARGRRGTGRSPANPTLLAAFLTSKASLSIQNPHFGVDIAKNLGLCLQRCVQAWLQVKVKLTRVYLHRSSQAQPVGGSPLPAATIMFAAFVLLLLLQGGTGFSRPAEVKGWLIHVCMFRLLS